MIAFYNDTDPYCARWLRNLIDAGEIMPGVVDTRSITEIDPHELEAYTQVHLFAGLGGWALAARMAGWPDDRPLWTGSCPCQPFSVAGKDGRDQDSRHLWPDMYRLIRACRPPTVMGEQVAAAIGKDWLDGVFDDLERLDYSCRALVVPACAVNAPHRRDRAWFVAGIGLLDYCDTTGLEGLDRDDGAEGRWSLSDRPAAATGCGSVVSESNSLACGQGDSVNAPCVDRSGARQESGSGCGSEVDPVGVVRNADEPGAREEWEQRSGQLGRTGGDSWATDSWIIGHDGKARRFEPGIRLLVNGATCRMGKLRAYGNAIVPQVAAEILASWMECYPC